MRKHIDKNQNKFGELHGIAVNSQGWGLLSVGTPRQKPRERRSFWGKSWTHLFGTMPMILQDMWTAMKFLQHHLHTQFSCIWSSFHSTVDLETAVCTIFWPVRPPKHLDKLLQDWLQSNILPSLFQKVEPILALGPHFWPSVWYDHLDCNMATSSRLTTRHVNKLWTPRGIYSVLVSWPKFELAMIILWRYYMTMTHLCKVSEDLWPSTTSHFI